MKWRAATSLSQLCLMDDEGFMCELAVNSEHLALFNVVHLIASHDDTYVPSYSAWVSLPVDATPLVASLQRDMVASLERVPDLARIDLAFEFSALRSARARMDAAIGRQAHVHILESKPLVLALVLCYGPKWFPPM